MSNDEIKTSDTFFCCLDCGEVISYDDEECSSCSSKRINRTNSDLYEKLKLSLKCYSENLGLDPAFQ